MAYTTHIPNNNDPLTTAHLSAVLETVDRIQDAAIGGQLDDVARIDRREMIEWLKDITYTIQETLIELQA